jgi:nitroreductase
VIVSLFEAARWAASASNEQPWHYIAASREDADAFARALDCLVPGNQAWARNAGLLILTVARLTRGNGEPYRHALHDMGLASAQLTFQAMASGLMVHQMAGIDRDKVRATYKVPEGYEPLTAIAVGYQADPETLPVDKQSREREPRQRKPLAGMVFSGEFGKASALVS